MQQRLAGLPPKCQQGHSRTTAGLIAVDPTGMGYPESGLDILGQPGCLRCFAEHSSNGLIKSFAKPARAKVLIST